MEVWAAIISVLGTLIGVALGSFGQHLLFKRQYAATVIGANRQAWINELRDLIAEFLALTGEISTYATHDTLPGDILDLILAHNRRLLLITNKVRLMLNEDDRHRQWEIVRLMQQIADCVIISNRRALHDVAVPYERLQKEAARVLKTEWSKIVRGE